MPPNIPEPTTTPPPRAMAIVRSLKMRMGMRAALPIRVSTQMKAISPAMPMAYAVSELGEVQPHSRPCSATSSNGTTPTTRVNAPHQSMADGRAKWETCRVRATMSRATRPTGTLTRNTQRHPVIPRIESAPAKNPPMIGPSTDEVPKTARK
ncbi:MAG: hypothetical protein BWY91_02915 [bacterium ADurb.BinA028]|nr:MAG: hypothetical protein BWY91_02915 [bacterium ADurb.BinA028]